MRRRLKIRLLVISILTLSNLSAWTLPAAEAQPFVTTWKTDNEGDSGNNRVTIPTNTDEYTYNYDIYWEDVNDSTSHGTLTGSTGNVTIVFPAAGIYRIEISGDFPAIRFPDISDSQKLLTIEQWGDIAWSSMSYAFYGCSNLTLTATDAPDLSGVTDMSFMFSGASTFNGDISNWDVSSVTDMRFMFSNASTFNQDIGNWNVSNVTDMRFMFRYASAFNRDISNWNVSNVTNMQGVFFVASTFDQNLGGWNVSNVNTMTYMLSHSALSVQNYEQTLAGWAALDSLQSGVRFDAERLKYCDATSRQALIDTYSWLINGDRKRDPIPDVSELPVLNVQCPGYTPDTPSATDCDGNSIEGTTETTFPLTESSTITWRYTDDAGNIDFQTQEVVIEDTIAPVAGVTSLTDITAQCSVDMPTAPAATDNCSGTVTGTTEAAFPLTASSTITWTYTDDAGNTTTQTQEVIIIEDTIAPVADVTSLTDITAQCSVDMPTAPAATDNCSGTVTGTTETTFPLIESSTITWLYTDDAGNVATQTQEVVIEDTTAPVPDVTSLTDITARCSADMPAAPTATDNCSGTVTGTTETTFPLTASSTIIWTYTDEAGNAITQTQEVIIDCVPLGVEPSETGIHIYPNPVTHQLTIESETAERVVLYTLSGTKVLAQTLENNSRTLDVADLRPGLYLVNVFAKGKRESFSLIKE